MKWTEIEQSEKWASLTPQQRRLARERYFDEFVAPNAPETFDPDELRTKWMAYSDRDEASRQPGSVGPRSRGGERNPMTAEDALVSQAQNAVGRGVPVAEVKDRIRDMDSFAKGDRPFDDMSARARAPRGGKPIGYVSSQREIDEATIPADELMRRDQSKYEAETTFGERLRNRVDQGFAKAETGLASLPMNAAVDRLQELERTGDVVLSWRNDMPQYASDVFKGDAWEDFKRRTREEAQNATADFAASTAMRNRYTASLPQSPARQYAQKTGDWKGGFLADPLGYSADAAVPSAVAMAPALAVAGIARNPVAGAAVMGLTGFTNERAGSMVEYLADHGVNTASEDAIRKALSDPEMFAAADKYATTRAAIIAPIDAIGAGLASRTIAPGVKGLLRREAVNTLVGQPIAQAAVGGAGEAAAGLATKGKVGGVDVFDEVLGGVAMSPVETAPYALDRVVNRNADTIGNMSNDALREAANNSAATRGERMAALMELAARGDTADVRPQTPSAKGAADAIKAVQDAQKSVSPNADVPLTVFPVDGVPNEDAELDALLTGLEQRNEDGTNRDGGSGASDRGNQPGQVGLPDAANRAVGRGGNADVVSARAVGTDGLPKRIEELTAEDFDAARRDLRRSEVADRAASGQPVEQTVPQQPQVSVTLEPDSLRSRRDAARARNDFDAYLSENGVDMAESDRRSADNGDRVPQPSGEPVMVGESRIAGRGIIATDRVTKPVTLFDLSADGPVRTDAGRYVNHSPQPNADVKIVQGRIVAIPNREIQPGQELTINYREIDPLREQLATRQYVPEPTPVAVPDFAREAAADPDKTPEAFGLPKPLMSRGKKRTGRDFDENYDDALDFLALNGGLDRAAWASQGVDPDMLLRKKGNEWNKRFAANGPTLFPARGGMTPDQAREMLQQRGFFAQDVDGSSTEANDAIDLVMESINQGRVFRTPSGSDVDQRRDNIRRMADSASRDLDIMRDGEVSPRDIVDANDWDNRERVMFSQAEGIESSEISQEEFDSLMREQRARMTERENDRMVSLAPDEFTRRVWQRLSEIPELAQNPKVSGSTPSEVVAAAKMGAELTGITSGSDESGPHQVHYFKLPDRIVERDGRRVTDKGGVFAVKVYKNAVEVNVSDLKPGENGSRIYNAVAGLADSTGKLFRGDTQGLSDWAILRRTENMVSNALKYGADTVAPHPRQTSPGGKMSWAAPLKWTPDPEKNLSNLLLTSAENVARLLPEIDNYTYNWQAKRFEDANGNRVDKDDLDALSVRAGQNLERMGVRARDSDSPGQATNRDGQGVASATPFGRNSIARAILTRSLVRSTGSEGRSGILAATGAQRAELSLDEALRGITYSQPTRVPNQPDATRGRKPAAVAGAETRPSGIPKSAPSQKSMVTTKLGNRLRDFGINADFERVTLPDALASTLDALGRITGRNVVVFRVTKGKFNANGFVLPGDPNIYVNADSESPVLTVASHEFLHQLRKDRPDLYSFIAAEVEKRADMQAWREELDQRPLTRGKNRVNDDSLLEELVADGLGDSLSDPQFLASLAKRNPTKFRDFVMKALDYFSGLLRKIGRMKSLGSDQYLSDIQGLRDAYAQMLDDYDAGVMPDQSEGVIQFQSAWHGTPHKVDRFRLDKIGTGEGAQAYGWGLYFAKQRDIAEHYRTTVSSDVFRVADGELFRPDSLQHMNVRVIARRGDLDGAIAKARELSASDSAVASLAASDLSALEAIKARGGIEKESGQLYHAEIPEDSDLLDWDKPLSEQPEKVREALQQAASPKGLGQIGARDADRFANVVQGSAFRAKGYRGLDVPSQRIVLKGMREVVNNLKVFDTVVPLIPVDMVNILRGEQFASEKMLHDPSMFLNLLSTEGRGGVTLSVDAANAAIRRIADAASAEMFGVGDQSVRVPEDFLSALRAGDFDQKNGSEIYGAIQRELGSPQSASNYLMSIGISGTRYLDGNSRNPFPFDVQVFGKSGALLKFEKVRSRAAADAMVADAEAAGNTAKVIERPVEAGSHNYVIWDEAAIGEPVPQFSQPRKQSDSGFYSALVESVTEGKGAPKRADATAWKQWLDGAQRRGEFKQSERDWIGVDAWLDGRATTTREELADFVRANEVQVQDVVLGQTSWADAIAKAEENNDTEAVKLLRRAESMSSNRNRGVGINDSTHNILNGARQPQFNDQLPSGDDRAFMTFEALDRAKGYVKANTDPKFAQYTLPGGKNYRELLLTLPVKTTLPDGFSLKQIEAGPRKGQWAVIGPGPLPENRYGTGATQAEAIAAFGAHGHNGPTYKSSHFDQPNILAHVRFNERTDADGKRVLFVEEVQSDWHQEGRKRGYQNTGPSADSVAAAQRSFDESAARNENAGDWRRNNPEHAAVLQAEFRNDNGVPDAPLKKEWPLTAMKRMIRWASENGFDRIAWTTGDQQAARYDLSKQISKIEYIPTAEGVGASKPGVLRAWGLNGRNVLDKNVPPDDLADHVGKEVAERLLSSEPAYTTGSGKPVHRLEGLDLKIGGDGMRAFYDKMLPNELGKYVKKWGGKVGQGQIEYPVASEKRAKGGAVIAKNERFAVHSIDITPAMREAAMEGQPLFSQPRTPAQAAAENAQKRATVATATGAQQPVTFTYTDRFEGPIRGRLNKLREGAQDKMLSALFVQEDIEAARGAIADAVNVYRRENLMHGRTGDQLETLKRTHVDPLVKAIKAEGLDDAVVEDYLEAKFAPERNKIIAAKNPSMPDGGSGMTDAEAADFLAGKTDGFRSGRKITPADTAKLQRIESKIKALRVETLDRLESSGLINAQAKAAMLAQAPNYVPLRGKDGAEITGGRGGAGKGIDVRGKPIKEALGRGAGNRAVNILAEMIADAERSIVQAEKNRVGKTLARLVLENPNPDLWEVEPVRLEQKLDSVGQVYQAVQSNAQDQDAIRIMHDGKPYFVRLSDPKLRDAMKNLGVDNSGAVIKFMGGINRYFSAVLTRYNPSFIAVNALRDLGFGMTGIAAEHGAKIAGNAAAKYPAAMRAMWRDNRGTLKNAAMDRYAREFSEAGGKTFFAKRDSVEEISSKVAAEFKSYGKLLRRGQVGLAWNKAVNNSALLKVVNDANDAVENAMRLSAYAALRESGKSVEQAAEYAKNITVNFNRKGQVATAANAVILFYNAATQGAHRSIKLLRNPKVIAAMGGLAGLQALLAAYAMGSDDEDDDGLTAWEKIPAYEKERNLIIPIVGVDAKGNRRIRMVKWPMPYGFNVFSYAGGRMAELAMTKEPKPAKFANDMGNAVVNAFSPVKFIDGMDGIKPHFMKIFDALGKNEDDLGMPIRVSDDFDKFPKPRAYSGKADTPEAYKAIAKGLNAMGGGDEVTPPKMFAGMLDWAPEDLEYLTEQLTGGLGRFASDSYGVSEKLFAGIDTKPTDYPVLRSFVGEVDQNRATQGVYYDRGDEIEREKARLRLRFNQGGIAAANKLIAETPELQGFRIKRFKSGQYEDKNGSITIEAKAGLAKTFKDAEKEVKRLNTEIRAAQAQTFPSLKAKSDRIKELQSQREKAQREFNEAFAKRKQ